MKKIFLFISILSLFGCVIADEFPIFPMTIYGNIKVGNNDLAGGTLNVYSSNSKLVSYTITESGKYGSTNVGIPALVINSFNGNLTFKVNYNSKNYVVDSIDDSNRGEGCPSKSSITFVSNDCRYDIVLKEESSSSNNNGGGGGGGGGGGDTPKNTTVKTGTAVNSGITTDEPKRIENNPTTTTDNSWYQEGNQSEILNNGYSREFNNAYKFAYMNGITTMDSIDKANMNGPLNRIAMAKMLSNYAMNILGKKPANVIVPNFPDVSPELNEQYGGAVTLAYQLGIMGLNIEKFRPNDSVTRAEFGTALSRMLYGLADGTDKYYTTHLAKLKAEGIISNDNPSLKELRGYVMLMLMRSAM